MRNFPESPWVFNELTTIRAYHTATLQNDIKADVAFAVDCHIWVKDAVLPHKRILLNYSIGIYLRSFADVHILANVDIAPEGLVQAINMCLPNATIAFVNDANAAALGEAWAGVAVGVPSFVLIALGTGVGAGVVVDGKLAAGAFGAGGEIGHIIVEPEETLTCGCGRHGCLEQYASAKGVVRLYLEECVSRGVVPVSVEHETDTVSVFRAHAQGDECATLAIHKMCHYLGLAMAQVSCVVDPAMFLIGGGVAGSFATFATELRECFEQYALPVSKGARIEAASLGNQAAMYGCAYEALRLRKERFGQESAE